MATVWIIDIVPDKLTKYKGPEIKENIVSSNSRITMIISTHPLEVHSLCSRNVAFRNYDLKYILLFSLFCTFVPRASWYYQKFYLFTNWCTSELSQNDIKTCIKIYIDGVTVTPKYVGAVLV